MFKRIDRRVLVGGIAIATIVLLTLFAAPQSNRQVSGSTFSRAPDGYGAWNAYMERQGTPIQRWQKRSEDFIRSPQSTFQKGAKTTFLQINTGFLPFGLSQAEKGWIRQGNTMVILGAGNPPATEASFTTIQENGVRVDTARRRKLENGETQLLGDRYGAIVWEDAIGKGKVIYSITPFLAANAYQDEPGNFAFLEKLVRQKGNSIWVDEYLHGYKETEVAKREDAENWVVYLLKTPVLPISVQIGILVLVLIGSSNRRFGQPVPLAHAVKDSSGAYIEALAGVLHQANRSEFVINVVGREEQLHLQWALGLGDKSIDTDTLKAAWVEQTGRSAEEIEQVLSKGQHLSEQDLLTWLNKIQEIRKYLPQT